MKDNVFLIGVLLFVGLLVIANQLDHKWKAEFIKDCMTQHTLEQCEYIWENKNTQ
jgi:hypothetical protein